MPRHAADRSTNAVYSPVARRLHWLVFALVAVQVPIGFIMSYRGNKTDTWDGMTNGLYSTHKAIGFLLLWLVVIRLAYRLTKGAPADEPTLEWWQKAASHLTHWGLYGLLVAIPMLGWLGVSLYDARSIFGLFSLPALAAKNTDASNLVFALHFYAAMLLAAMVMAHIGAALYHHLIRKDGVLRRMLPGLKHR